MVMTLLVIDAEEILGDWVFFGAGRPVGHSVDVNVNQVPVISGKKHTTEIDRCIQFPANDITFFGRVGPTTSDSSPSFVNRFSAVGHLSTAASKPIARRSHQVSLCHYRSTALLGPAIDGKLAISRFAFMWQGKKRELKSIFSSKR